MTISELGAVGEFVGSIAVLITLVYLAIQVRQTKNQIEANTNAILGSSEIDGNSTTHKQLMSIYNNESVADMMLRGLARQGDLSGTELVRFNASMDAAFQLHQITFLQWKKRLLSDEYWEFCIRFFGARVLATPGGQAWWTANSPLFIPEYRDLIDRVIEGRGWENASAFVA